MKTSLGDHRVVNHSGLVRCISGLLAVLIVITASSRQASAANVTWNTTTGVWDVNNTANWTGGATKFNNNDNATFDNTAGGTVTLTGAGIAPASTTVSAASGIYTFSGTAITGGGNLLKSGAGTLVLNNLNTYTGTTTVDAGILQLASGFNNRIATNAGDWDVTGTISVLGVNVQLLPNKATLHGGTLTGTTPGLSLFGQYAARMGGSTIAHVGNATSTIDVPNSIALQGSGNLTFDVADGSQDIDMLVTATSKIIPNASPTGGIIKKGDGTLSLGGANTYTGATTVDAGKLILTGISTGTSTGTSVVVNAGTLQIAAVNALSTNGGDWDVTGTVTVTGPFVQLLGDKVTLHGGTLTGTGLGYASNGFGHYAARMTGTTIVHVGDFMSKIDVPTTSLNLQGAGNLTFDVADGASATDLSVTTPIIPYTMVPLYLGTGGVVKIGAGTVSVSSANSYTGATAISAGTYSTASVVVSAANASGLGNATTAVTLGAASTQGVLSYTGNNATYTRGFTLNAGGGRINTTTSGQTLIIGTNNITSASNGSLTIGGAGNTTISSSIQIGSGGIIKTDAGTLVLSAANTYSGNTTVSGGLLSVTTGTLGSNAFNKVFIAAPTNNFANNPTLSRSKASIGNSYVGVGSTELGGSATTAELLFGTASTGTSVDMQWRLPTTAESTNPSNPPLSMSNHSGLFSDVLNLSGMGTDKFVLQMLYDQNKLPGGAGSELAMATQGQIFVGWLSGGLWQNAVLGNTPSTSQFMGAVAWSGAYTTLGQWGVDPTTHHAWAVLNHNSDFAVVPEPNTFATLLFGSVGFWTMARKRRCARLPVT